MSVRKTFGVLAFGAAFAIGSAALAQQQVQQTQAGQAGQGQQQNFQQGAQGRAGQAGQQSQWQGIDHFIASCLITDNQLEVALSKFAKDKTDNKDIKDLCDHMIKDHEQFQQQLAKWAPDAAQFQLTAQQSSRSGQGQQANQQNQAQNKNQNNSQIQQTAGTQQQGGRLPSPLDLHREVAQLCLANAQKDLSEKKDKDDVNMCFIAATIFAHKQMLDKLEVDQRHVSPDMAKVLADGSSHTKEHLKQAEKIMDQLTGKSGDGKSTAGKDKDRGEKRE